MCSHCLLNYVLQLLLCRQINIYRSYCIHDTSYYLGRVTCHCVGMTVSSSDLELVESWLSVLVSLTPAH